MRFEHNVLDELADTKIAVQMRPTDACRALFPDETGA
jgi:hypothetical protein